LQGDVGQGARQSGLVGRGAAGLLGGGRREWLGGGGRLDAVELCCEHGNVLHDPPQAEAPVGQILGHTNANPNTRTDTRPSCERVGACILYLVSRGMAPRVGVRPRQAQYRRKGETMAGSASTQRNCAAGRHQGAQHLSGSNVASRGHEPSEAPGYAATTKASALGRQGAASGEAGCGVGVEREGGGL